MITSDCLIIPTGTVGTWRCDTWWPVIALVPHLTGQLWEKQMTIVHLYPNQPWIVYAHVALGMTPTYIFSDGSTFFYESIERVSEYSKDAKYGLELMDV